MCLSPTVNPMKKKLRRVVYPKKTRLACGQACTSIQVCHACCVFSQKIMHAGETWWIICKTFLSRKNFGQILWSCNLNRCLRLNLEIYCYIYSKRNSKEIGAMLTSSRWHKKVKRLIKICTRLRMCSSIFFEQECAPPWARCMIRLIIY